MKEYCIKLALVRVEKQESGEYHRVEVAGPAIIDFDAPYVEKAVDVFNKIDKAASPAIKEALKKFIEENKEVS